MQAHVDQDEFAAATADAGAAMAAVVRSYGIDIVLNLLDTRTSV
jgi:hypothetical protein